MFGMKHSSIFAASAASGAGLLALTATLLFAPFSHAGSNFLDQIERIPGGPTMPEYAFKELTRDGETQDWGFIEFADKPLVVVLWATWCGICADEMPKLDRLAAELGDRANVIALSQDRGDINILRRYYDDQNLNTLRMFQDTDGVTAAKLGMRGVPMTFIAAPGGQLKAYAEGPVNWQSPQAQNFILTLSPRPQRGLQKAMTLPTPTIAFTPATNQIP